MYIWCLLQPSCHVLGIPLSVLSTIETVTVEKFGSPRTEVELEMRIKPLYRAVRHDAYIIVKDKFAERWVHL